MSPQGKVHQSRVKSCDWAIEQLPGISQEEQAQLLECGIATTKELLRQGSTPEKKHILASKLHVHIQYVNKWLAMADLARIEGIGCQYCGLLLHAGIASVAQLAQTPIPRLHQQIMRLQVATMQRRDLCPSIEQVRNWVQQAQII